MRAKFQSQKSTLRHNILSIYLFITFKKRNSIAFFLFLCFFLFILLNIQVKRDFTYN